MAAFEELKIKIAAVEIESVQEIEKVNAAETPTKPLEKGTLLSLPGQEPKGIASKKKKNKPESNRENVRQEALLRRKASRKLKNKESKRLKEQDEGVEGPWNEIEQSFLASMKMFGDNLPGGDFNARWYNAVMAVQERDPDFDLDDVIRKILEQMIVALLDGSFTDDILVEVAMPEELRPLLMEMFENAKTRVSKMMNSAETMNTMGHSKS